MVNKMGDVKCQILLTTMVEEIIMEIDVMISLQIQIPNQKINMANTVEPRKMEMECTIQCPIEFLQLEIPSVHPLHITSALWIRTHWGRSLQKVQYGEYPRKGVNEISRNVIFGEAFSHLRIY